MTGKYCLPETLADWPWPRRINPFYEEVKAESADWFRSFNAFSPKAQKAFDLCDFSLLASLAYPDLSKEHLRTGCDLMNLFFVFDEYTDVEDPEQVEAYADIVMDAIRSPIKERPEGECILGEVARQFWNRAIKTASPTSQERFVYFFGRYTKSVVDQAKDRSEERMRSIDEYFNIRRLTIGTDPSYIPIELAMNIPAEAFYHPIVQGLTQDVTDIILLDNDMCSYNKEQAAGDDLHNIIRIAMSELNLDLQGAFDWLASVHGSKIAHFFETWNEAKKLTWGPEVDAEMTIYLDGLANWIRANDCWNFESGRYFGQEGLSIQQHRVVDLMPKNQPMLLS